METSYAWIHLGWLLLSRRKYLLAAICVVNQITKRQPFWINLYQRRIQFVLLVVPNFEDRNVQLNFKKTISWLRRFSHRTVNFRQQLLALIPFPWHKHYSEKLFFKHYHCWMIYSGAQEHQQSRGSVKKLRAMETMKNKTIVTNCDRYCSTTLLTSKLIKWTIEKNCFNSTLTW